LWFAIGYSNISYKNKIKTGFHGDHTLTMSLLNTEMSGICNVNNISRTSVASVGFCVGF